MLLPLDQNSGAADLVGLSIDEAAILVKVVVKRGMARDKLFATRQAFGSTTGIAASPGTVLAMRPPHGCADSASLEGWVGILGLIVQPAAHLVPVAIARLPHCRRIGSKTVGDGRPCPTRCLISIRFNCFDKAPFSIA